MYLVFISKLDFNFKSWRNQGNRRIYCLRLVLVQIISSINSAYSDVKFLVYNQLNWRKKTVYILKVEPELYLEINI